MIPNSMALEEVWERVRSDSNFDKFRAEGQPMVPGEYFDEICEVKYFVVAGAPGAREALQRKPFVGQVGLLVRQLLGLADISESECYFTYVAKYRLPGGAQPGLRDEMQFKPYLRQEFAAVGAPPVIITIGADAWHAFGGTEAVMMTVSTVAGTVRELRTNDRGEYLPKKAQRLLVPMLSPGLGLHEPRLQEKIERDWEHLPQALSWWKEKGLA